MTVPGLNILAMAFRVLGKQCFQYYAYQSRTPDNVGQYVTTYARRSRFTEAFNRSPATSTSGTAWNSSGAT
ncbi:hypothetical protein FRUB_06109 [Fimbriiglobus ruber]|uniref:Uncharacterized protein n=1 Tax=Fimbriiglobus ruber TaxID=1908690 RepID=A0A225DPW5_9BACT|nr:hypothetical protein [Fimbriiglobus ruber]OWK39546.1 hypothetical protein FRUB_06109 [Fimbriiglobus ruber]